MGWLSKIGKKIKKVFKKVTKVVKKIVKGVGKVAKKVWNGVKKVAKKGVDFFTKLGPVANIAMSFIPGFGQLWQAYGVWGKMAKGAITGYLSSGGNVKGALLGAAGAYAGDWYSKLPGKGVGEKIMNRFSGEMSFDKSYSQLSKGYTGRIGIDTTKSIPPSMRGQYAYSAPSISSIQGAYDANMASGMTSEAAIAGLNAQGARDAQYWMANPPPKKKKDLSDLSSILSSQSESGGIDFIPDTSALTDYSGGVMAKAGVETGTGIDTYDVRTLGLMDAIERTRRGKLQFST